MGEEVSGFFFHSNAWLLLVHWSPQSPYIHPSEPPEILGPENGMHVTGLEGVRDTGCMLTYPGIVINQFYTISPGLLWMWSWVEDEILPNGEKETALCLSLQPVEKSPTPWNICFRGKAKTRACLLVPPPCVLSPGGHRGNGSLLLLSGRSTRPYCLSCVLLCT